MRSLSTLIPLLATTPGECLPSLFKHGDDKTTLPHSPWKADDSPLGPAPLITDSEPHTKTPSSCNYGWPTLLAPIVSVQACQDYLAGPEAAANCAVPPPPIGEDPKAPPPAYGSRLLCRQPDNTVVMGATFNIFGASSACRDVATAVQWILDACTVEGEVAGQSPAFGNGDLIVVVQQGMNLTLTA